MTEQNPIGAEGAEVPATAVPTDSPTPEVKSGETASPERTDWKGLALSRQGSAEEANRLRKELEELRARSSQPPTSTQPPSDPLADAWQQTLYLANQGDPTSKMLVALAQEYANGSAKTNADITFASLPSDEKSGAEELWRSGNYKTPQVAIEANRLKLELARAKKSTDETAAKRREAEESARVAAATAPSTSTVSASATKSGVTTVTEFTAQWKAAKATNNRAEIDRLKLLELTPGGIVQG